MDEDNKFPSGWGNNEDDEDYGFDDTDDDSPAWGSSSPAVSADKAAEPARPADKQPEDSKLTSEKTPPPPAVSINQPYQAGAAAKKSSAAVPILIAVIVILLAAMGIIGGMLFMKSKKDDASDSSSSQDSEISENTMQTTVSSYSEETVPTRSTETEAVITSIASDTTTAAATEPAPALPAPTASAYIGEVSFYPQGNGSSFVLHVSGDYSYYYYEGYYTGGGEYDYMCSSGITDASSIEITAGSVMNEVRAIVIPYNADDAAGETVAVSITPQYSTSVISGNAVTPCTKYGRINVHGGVVAGFATSYVVDGGAVSKIRTSLGDGWHITAVNQYVSGSVTWYELYDSDDGDYYGWVDSDYIDFY